MYELETAEDSCSSDEYEHLMKPPEKPKSLPHHDGGDYMTVQKDISKPMQSVDTTPDPGPILTPPEQYKEEEVKLDKELACSSPVEGVPDKSSPPRGTVMDTSSSPSGSPLDKDKDVSPSDKAQIELSSPDPGHIEVQVLDIQVGNEQNYFFFKDVLHRYRSHSIYV